MSKPPKEGPAASELVHTEQSEHGLKTRVLLVETDRTLLRSLEPGLREIGYDVVIATSAHEATRLALQRDPGILLVGQGTEDDAAVAMMHTLRRHRPGARRILMTSNDGSTAVHQSIGNGLVMGILKKPVTLQDVRSTLARVEALAHRMHPLANSQELSLRRRRGRMLDTSLEKRMLSLAGQPILAAATSQQLGVEVLLRSRHPVLSTPRAVLRAAEDHGRLLDVGAEVFRLAGQHLGHATHLGRLFINVHPQQLVSLERLSSDLQPLLPFAHQVVLELTGGEQLGEVSDWAPMRDWLTSRGFQLAIDDMGGGAHSLALLADAQPHFIKLDMSLSRNIHTAPRTQRMVAVIQAFAQTTGGTVIAQGVENEAERDALAALGVSWMQGYYFGVPEDLQHVAVPMEPQRDSLNDDRESPEQSSLPGRAALQP